jgi:hypothetical protein
MRALVLREYGSVETALHWETIPIHGALPPLRQPLTEAGVMRWACESSQE